mmetsp:Transcript_5764/g.12695  ORF Transcript_5764/g.12695 Transcript_5764/m.12695 type:complete len:104 (+) Transcript_5764:521-832(+)
MDTMAGLLEFGCQRLRTSIIPKYKTYLDGQVSKHQKRTEAAETAAALAAARAEAGAGGAPIPQAMLDAEDYAYLDSPPIVAWHLKAFLRASHRPSSYNKAKLL